MKIVKFKGGLGNQMFQYAFMKSIEKETKNICKADLSAYNKVYHELCLPKILDYNIHIEVASNEEKNNICYFPHKGSQFTYKYKIWTLLEIVFNNSYYYEWSRAYRNLKKIIKYKYYDGCWQCVEYFKSLETELRKDFTPKNGISEKGLKAIEEIQKVNAILVGFRRGDYFSTSKMIKRYGSCDINYYQKAINYMCEIIDSPVFYVTSDDMEWVKKNIQFKRNVIYRDKDERVSDVEEIIVLSKCKHAIIANSTFLWWMAWLIDNKDKIVIAPKNWYADGSKTDIIPAKWVKM